ncbi:MAG: hypothetical protein HOL45_07900 [Chloroflexi bacterium]|nr:hypothetical protein [Chloroflexota bacterium]
MTGRTKNMLWFNACPHCSTGTAEARSDSEGKFLQCMSCSWTLYAPRYGRVDAHKEPLLAGIKSTPGPEESPRDPSQKAA